VDLPLSLLCFSNSLSLHDPAGDEEPHPCRPHEWGSDRLEHTGQHRRGVCFGLRPDRYREAVAYFSGDWALDHRIGRHLHRSQSAVQESGFAVPFRRVNHWIMRAVVWFFVLLTCRGSLQATVVFDATSPYHHIRVIDNRGLRVLSFDGSLETR